MFKHKNLVVILLMAALVCPLDAFARGGRGGGGGGGRGGGGGGRSMGGGGSASRSPSMSRPSTPSHSRPSAPRPNTGGARPGTGAAGARPAAGGAGARPVTGAGAAGRPGAGAVAAGGRPSSSQLNSFLNVPGKGAGPGAGGRPAAGSLPAGGNSAVSDFFHSGGGAMAAGAAVGSRAGQAGARAEATGANRQARTDGRTEGRGNRQEARVETRGDRRSSLSEGRGERQTERQQQLGDRADSIRDELSNQFDENHLFEDFWRENPGAYANFHQNPALWTWATFATASAFMPWNWGSGSYYDYGSSGGGTSSSDSGTVYADEATYSSPEYSAEAEELAASAPEEPPADAEWLPLGVFAATTEDNSAAPNMFLQLAVSKEGIIAGTYQNKTTSQTESLEGMVDQESQRVAWTVSGKNTPIMETGLENLTMNETQALVHFADGTTQRWLLVRVAKPEDSQPASPPQQ